MKPLLALFPNPAPRSPRNVRNVSSLHVLGQAGRAALLLPLLALSATAGHTGEDAPLTANNTPAPVVLYSPDRLWQNHPIAREVWSPLSLPADQLPELLRQLKQCAGESAAAAPLLPKNLQPWSPSQPAADGAAPLIIMTHALTPARFRPLPYTLTLTFTDGQAPQGVRLFLDGAELKPAESSVNERRWSVPPAHFPKSGVARIVLVLPEARAFEAALRHPGDVRFYRALPPEIDPDINRKNWQTRTLAGGGVRATVALPDVEKGVYRGNRFEQAGQILHLEAKGHTFFLSAPEDLNPLDSGRSFGLGEEAFEALGWKECLPGEPYVKFGVGLFPKILNEEYAWYDNLLPAQERFAWTTEQPSPNELVFTQEVRGPRGWSYHYTKRLILNPAAPCLHIRHELTNTGTRPLQTDQYCHNWVRLDNRPIGKGYSVEFSFLPVLRPANNKQGQPPLQITGNRINLTGGTPYPGKLEGWRFYPRENGRFLIRCADTPAALEISGDFPLSEFSWYSSAEALCLEPFVRLDLQPGQSQSWTRTYRFLLPDN